jgi:3',5'-cyclic AMP phosphodiesterase CpdA
MRRGRPRLPGLLPTRRQALLGGAAALALSGCERFDAISWISRERYDVDRRFTDSTEELTAPLPPLGLDADAWSALLVGDFHFYNDEVNENIARIAAYQLEQPFDLLLQLGDLADAGWPLEFATARAALDGLGVPVYGVIGNHDIYHEGWSSYRDYFGSSVFSLPVGRVLFVALDEAGGTLGGLQRPWLEAQLAAATADHVVLLGHYPLWGAADEGFSQLASEEEVYDLLDLMRRYGVRAHVSGHTHRWASTELDGMQLITLGSMKEAGADRCGLRLDVRGAELTLTRVDFGEAP